MEEMANGCTCVTALLPLSLWIACVVANGLQGFADKWPRTVSGLPSTSGTTASIAIVKKSKLYIGHVGDSGIVLGCDEGPRNAIFMKPKCLTKVTQALCFNIIYINAHKVLLYINIINNSKVNWASYTYSYS